MEEAKIIYDETFAQRIDIRTEEEMSENLKRGNIAQNVAARLFYDLGYTGVHLISVDKVDGKPDIYISDPPLPDLHIEVQTGMWWETRNRYPDFPETNNCWGIHVRENKIIKAAYIKENLYLLQATETLPRKVYILDILKYKGYGPLKIIPWGYKLGYFFPRWYLDKYCIKKEDKSPFDIEKIEKLWFPRWQEAKSTRNA